ncbi:MAG: metallophosphoesterase [Clostridia bacterium]|nr:metallophosphoesterase [Clostridia bacterium]
MIYITGDTHGEFGRVEYLCNTTKTSKDDILIILGDAGINFYGNWRDELKKEKLQSLPLTVFSIHGNHENRPDNIPSYHLSTWHGGMVWREEKYPDILFARDGEVYDMDGLRTIAIGGAYSVDKVIRLLRGYPWWPDEQPSEAVRRRVEEKLDQMRWEVDVVLSHTVPLKYEPVEVFLPGIDQRTIDKSTETWLGTIEDRLSYRRWYCGHYHTEKEMNRITMLFESVRPFRA